MDEEERRAIELVIPELATGEVRLYEHVSATFRWLMATLFAANGGGLIALLDTGASELPGRNYALMWFALGMIFSLFMGALSAFLAYRATTAMVKMRLKLKETLITGQPVMKEVLDFIEGQQPTWRTWLPSYAGGASLIFFIVGLGTIAGSLVR